MTLIEQGLVRQNAEILDNQARNKKYDFTLCPLFYVFPISMTVIGAGAYIREVHLVQT